MGDGNAEMRTMVLLSLPYPPLPVLVSKTEDGKLSGEDVTTSHSFVARGLDEAMARQDPAENRARKARQLEVFQRFLHAMATEGFFGTVERLYTIYCAFTLDHIATYFPPGHPVDIRFEPLSSITRGDKAHAKMAEYMASQSVLFEDATRIRRDQYMLQGYGDMLRACRDRLGHAMTQEERGRVHER